MKIVSLIEEKGMWLETDRIHFIISGNCIRDFCEKSKMLAGATLAIGVIAPQVLPATAHADEQTRESTVNLRILETSDIHVNLMNYDYYQTKTDNKVGLVQTATLVNKAREEAKTLSYLMMEMHYKGHRLEIM